MTEKPVVHKKTKESYHKKSQIGDRHFGQERVFKEESLIDRMVKADTIYAWVLFGLCFLWAVFLLKANSVWIIITSIAILLYLVFMNKITRYIKRNFL